MEDAERLGIHVHFLDELRDGNAVRTVKRILASSFADAIFWGFDMDVVRAAEAPGVSDAGPVGLTARDVCELAEVAAAEPRTRIVEITEVNPQYDMDGQTCKLAAHVLARALGFKGLERPARREAFSTSQEQV